MPFSTRVFEGATVSAPLRWDELERGVRSGDFTVETMPRRLRALKRDPWEGFLETRQTLTKKTWAALAR